MAHRNLVRWMSAWVVVALAVAACATDPLETPEYTALARDLEAARSRADGAEELAATLGSRVESAEADRARLESDLADVRSDLDGVRDQLSDARREKAESDRALQAELTKPWPAAVKTMFVEECTADDDPSLSEEQERFLCSCVVDALEPQVTLEEFITFSVAVAAPDAIEVDPETGIPLGLDPGFVDLLAGVGFSCGLELAQPRVDAGRTAVLTASPDGLSLLGRARLTEGSVSLTRKSPGPMAGAVWTSEPVPVAGGFESQFVFEIDHVSWFTIGDGMAFVIQDVGPEVIGGGASGNGYKGIRRSLAVEFDTTFHSYEGEARGAVPGAGAPQLLTNHVAVHTMGLQPNTPNAAAALGSVDLQDVLLYDRMRHLALVRYEPGTLSVFVDDMTAPVLEVDVDLQDVLGGDDDTAWIGFTAGTEEGFYADFLIHGWTFDPTG